MTPEELRRVYEDAHLLAFKDNNWAECHDAAIRAVFEAGAGKQWQPIETAPKDGTHILAIEDDIQAVVACGLNGWFWVVAAHRYYIAPTHWMPLPPAPLAKVE